MPATVSETLVGVDPLQFLTAIWNRHYPQMLDRVASIDRVSISSADRSLTPEIRHQAWHCAHTLAGSLGTFGLPVGSQVAKQLELLLAENTDLTPADMLQLQTGVDRLRQEIASKMPVVETESVTPPTSRSAWLLVITTESDLASALTSIDSNLEIVTATTILPAQLAQSPAALVLDLDCFPHFTDGLTALADLDRDYPNMPILVLSQPTSSIDSQGMRRLQQRIEVARMGARLFLSKPLPASQILLAVDRVLAQSRVRQARVTIVDDDRLFLEGVSALLSLQGLTVTTLAEPSQFWETLEAAQPDLLILDLDMPTHDGIELCRAVRTDPQWASLPILFLTAHTAALAIDRIFAAGADDFVTKPVVEATLVNRVINRLQRSGLHQG
jgi:DNA-binding response OmpR family regulator